MNARWAAFTSRLLRDTHNGDQHARDRGDAPTPFSSSGWTPRIRPPRSGHTAGKKLRLECQVEGGAAMPSPAMQQLIDAFRTAGPPGPARPRPRWTSAAPASPPQAAPPGPMGARLVRLPDPPTASGTTKDAGFRGPRIRSRGQRRAVRLAGISWDPGRCAPSAGWCPSPRRRTRRTGARDCRGRYAAAARAGRPRRGSAPFRPAS
jgi:hypothetical protein